MTYVLCHQISSLEKLRNFVLPIRVEAEKVQRMTWPLLFVQPPADIRGQQSPKQDKYRRHAGQDMLRCSAQLFSPAGPANQSSLKLSEDLLYKQW